MYVYCLDGACGVHIMYDVGTCNAMLMKLMDMVLIYVSDVCCVDEVGIDAVGDARDVGEAHAMSTM